MPYNQQYKTLFLDPDYDISNVDEKVDIILSPSLYWIKKISLPLKSLREIKTLLPSIFEEILPDGVYSYSVYKSNEDDSFYAFAYEDKKILDLLAQYEIPMTNIASVRFAQSELNTIEGAVQINDEQCLYVKDSIVVLLPSAWVDEKQELSLDAITLSKHKIALQQFAHIIDYKSLYGVISVLLIFIFLTIGELVITTQRSDDVVAKTDEIFVTEDLKPTLFENRSILKKFEKRHAFQTQFRAHLADLLALKLNKNEKMTSLSLKKKVLLVDFSGVSTQRTAHISSTLKSEGMEFTQRLKDGILHLEIKI